MEKDNLYKEINNYRSKSESEAQPLRNKNGKPLNIQARILWPALGFPAVISPRENPATDSLLYSDATKCICVLILSNKPDLTKTEAAKHLRFSPWNERAKRYIAQGETGSFSEKDLIVISTSSRKLIQPEMKDMHGFGIAFGHDTKGTNSITVKLADYVNNFYQKNGLKYLYEIRVTERASKQLNEGQYNLFWNSEIADNTDRPSDEMNLLLKAYAKPKREEIYDQFVNQTSTTNPPEDMVIQAGTVYEQNLDYFLRTEYEYEYGSTDNSEIPQLHQKNPIRTEVLHPLFIQNKQNKELKIGHITDLHVSTRENVYQTNLADNFLLSNYDFNNWNTSFVNAYKKAKASQADALLFTGDLIDYGRGHLGSWGKYHLGNDDFYHADRNWFLFYSLLASGNSYSKPVFTILGNHDWRLNPYPPIALAGSPSVRTLFHNHLQIEKGYKEEEKKNLPLRERKFPLNVEDALKKAHGKNGVDRKLTYYKKDDLAAIKEAKIWGPIATIIQNGKALDIPHFPTETTIESIGWYLMAINPFLDYSFSLNDNTKILMLDWAEDENLLFSLAENGKSERYGVMDFDEASDSGPKTKNSLTSVQTSMISKFTTTSGKVKIIGIHAPPIGPYSSWSDEDLMKGKKIFKPFEKIRGSANFATKFPNGKIKKWNGHPIYAIKPDNIKHAAGIFADYGSIDNHRNWFIKKLYEKDSGVTAVLSGHIHRNGIYQVYQHDSSDKLLDGQLLVKSYYPMSKTDFQNKYYTNKPVFINTTSAGPRGNSYKEKLKEDEPKQSVDPGLALIDINENGRIDQIQFLSSRPGKDKNGKIIQ
jgi:3',5'-cyclic AMP phosphodiesterase CpdA